MSLTITIPGAVSTTTGSTAPAVLTVGVGAPGQGVPSGGTSGQVLQKLSGVSYDTGWLTLPADFITSVTSPLAVASGVLSVDLSAYSTTAQAAALYYPLSGNPSAFLTASALTPYATIASPTFTGVVTIPSGALISGYLTTADAVTSYYPLSGNPSGFITQGTADGLYYSISNPSGFITSGDLAGYATESFVTSQGYITASALTGYATESWVQSQGYLYPDANGVIQYPNGVMTDPAFPVGRFWYQSQKFRWTDGVAIRTVASESYVTTALGSYAPLAGATFTGKVNTVAPTSTNAGINIGSINSTANLTNSVAGDVWIGTWQMAYKTANGTLIYGAATNASNVFGSPQIIDTTNATPALRVTQKGTGNVLLVEDSLNPDATALVVEANGNVGIGVATGYTATQKVEVVGNVKADAFINGTGPTYNVKAIQAHSGGSDTHELLVSVNGSTYRVGMKFVSTP